MHRVTPRLVLPLFCLAASLSGCISTNAAMLHPSRAFAPVAPEQVHVFVAESDVPGPFEKVAVINAGGSSSFTNEAQMIRAMQRAAGRVGGNGVILGNILEPSAGAKVAGAVFGIDTQRKGTVVAIRFQAPAKTEPVASIRPESERDSVGVRRQTTHAAGQTVQPTQTPSREEPPQAPEPAQPVSRTPAPEARAGQGLWVTIPGARRYYWHECDVAQRLPQDRLIRFGTEEEAQAAGYEPPTFFPQCTGPAANR